MSGEWKKIGGLRDKKSKSGNWFYSGWLFCIHCHKPNLFTAHKHKYKKSEKDPAWHIFEPPKQEEVKKEETNAADEWKASGPETEGSVEGAQADHSSKWANF